MHRIYLNNPNIINIIDNIYPSFSNKSTKLLALGISGFTELFQRELGPIDSLVSSGLSTIELMAGILGVIMRINTPNAAIESPLISHPIN